MNKFIPAYIISHGMLDYLTFSNFTDIFIYTILVILNFFMFSISSDFVFLTFLTFSMYHFGEDFRYLTKGTNIDRYIGIMFVSGLGFYSKLTNINVLVKLLVLNKSLLLNYFKVFYIFSFIPCMFTNVNIIIISLIFNFLLHFIDPFVIFLSYINFVHVPLAIYRYYIKYGKDVLVSWSVYIIILLYFLPSVINVTIIKLSISIVNIHMIYITKWQNQRGLLHKFVF